MSKDKTGQINRKFERMIGVYNARQENEYHLPIKIITMTKEQALESVFDYKELDDRTREKIFEAMGMYAKQESERIVKMLEDELKRNMRINMPGISFEQQDETWQRYKKLNKL